MPTLGKTNLHARLRTARRVAQMAGHIIMANYGQQQTVNTKSSDVDLVTQVDIESDELIREVLREEFPEDKIVTEETFEEGQPIDLSNTWVIDPLDGTTNYAHGFPQFAVSIAYVEEGEPKAAVIFDPFKNEMFTAIESGEVHKNGLPIHVSAIDSLSKALLATGFPYDLKTSDSRHNNIDLHSQFLNLTHGIRRAGAAALDLAYLACGRLDGFWELRLAPWDVAAGILMIQCAGGKVTGLAGEKLDLSQRRINIVGSNNQFHDELIQVTSGFSV